MPSVRRPPSERRVPTLVALTVLGLFVIGGAPPEDHRSAAVVAAVQAEHDFATAAVTRNLRDAFLEFMGPDAIVFRPLPVPARPWFEARPAGPGQLSWRPAFADGARSGDLAWTTGPWSFRAGPDDTISGTGHYVTVWKRQADGAYRFAIDAGNSHAPSLVAPQRVGLPVTPGAPRNGTRVEREREKLLEQDRALGKGGTLETQSAALLASATDDVRVMRAGVEPAVGRLEARGLLAGRSGSLEVRPMGADVSTAGDLGYSYGLALHGGDGAAVDTSAYLRIWRRAKDGHWQVALDLDVPAPRRSS